MNKKSLLATLPLALLALAGGWWLVQRAPVRVDPGESASVAPPEPEAIDFDLLERTLPDEDYLPEYPPELEEVDGFTVRVRGFMTPYDDLENLETFLIMGFPTGCNFCAPPAVNQVVLARQPDRDKPYPFIDGPIEVTGRLHLWNAKSEDPAHRDEYLLYIMRDVTVKKLPPSEFQPKEDHRLPAAF